VGVLSRGGSPGGLHMCLHQPEVTSDGRDLPGYSAKMGTLSRSKSVAVDLVYWQG